ncbi:MAG: hypothetical protein O2856_06470, partial [Planctomycetota bacterium]|nr:hypothetical protein [Planctomycetota bacterium]
MMNSGILATGVASAHRCKTVIDSLTINPQQMNPAMKYETDPTAPKHIVRRNFLRQLSAASAAAMACSAP